MFRRRIDGELADHVHQEMMNPLKVSEEEIEAIANSTELYERVRLRIASRSWADAHRKPKPSLLPGFLTKPAIRWTLAAAAIILIFVLSISLLRTRQSVEPVQLATPSDMP